VFSLHDGNGTTHWRNGKQLGETIKVTIRNGRYTVLLGGQGMNSLAPELFLKHDKLYLKVEFDMGDGEGLRHLAPDQLITATPRALVAEVAKVAKVAEKVGNGAITRDMLNQEVLSQLDANATSSSSAPITITRNMLPKDVRDDLNKSVTITRSMLPADVLADLNKSSSSSSPITLSMLAPEVTAKLDQNGSGGNTTVNNPPVVGSLIALPYGQNAPAGYSLYQRGAPKELVWKEKAPVSVARFAYDGVEVLDGKIYFVGGYDGSAKNIAERYDPSTNTWETIAPMSVARNGVSSAVLMGKLYAIAGDGGTSVEIYDPSTDVWTTGPALPHTVNSGCAIVANEKLYHIGGWHNSQNFKFVHMLDPSTNSWAKLADMPTARHGLKLAWFDNRIWAVGGYDGSYINIVESFDPSSNSWRPEASMTKQRNRPFVFVANSKFFVGGGQDGSSQLNSIEAYDPITKRWMICGNFPRSISSSDSVELNNNVYVVEGKNSSYSNKVYAADLNASVAGVYDLYRKDGNASAGTPLVQAEVADGSVTTAKLDSTILKYLKPEITAQPQAQTVYADTNATFSITAEGKYLTYQWKKDGSDLAGETNSTLTITDANVTLHDGNYSVVVSNDFGSEESGMVTVQVSDALINGLVGWWKFDETNGTVAYDSSGNGNDGNLTGGPTWVNGKVGGALSFDGVNDSLFLNQDFFNNKSFTFSAWVKNSLNNRHILNHGSSPDPHRHLFFTLSQSVPANLTFSFYTNDLVSPFTGDSGWKIFTATYEIPSKDRRMYADGNLIASDVPATSYQGVGPFVLGKRSWGGLYYSLILDDIRIYNRALSAGEVQALYNLGQ
ncbi:immunoglobulin domain-containing protein, partial [Opitutales bacterium]|nr:immunoglobulin domain-containing protein [Opitutales bacterium]